MSAEVTEVLVSDVKQCDLCKQRGVNKRAEYDGKTLFGPWAYMCSFCFDSMGVGLGTGKGQRLIVSP